MFKQPKKSILLGSIQIISELPTCLEIRGLPVGNTNFLILYSNYVPVVLHLQVSLHKIYSFPVSVTHVEDVMFKYFF